MYPFRYVRPTSLDEAAALLERHAEARALSGGMTLLPTLKQRLANPSHLIDLARLPELHGATFDGSTLTLGAATTHAAVAASSTVKRAVPALADLAGVIADRQVRHRGTIGGSVANNDPAADYPAALLALQAVVITNRRRIKADEFFTGMFSTALEAGELITAVEFPSCETAVYVKRRHPASGYAMVGVFIACQGKSIRVAITGAGSSVFRWTEAEDALSEYFSAQALDPLSIDEAELPEDIHASADYRAELIKVYTRRAFVALTERLGSQPKPVTTSP